jgi:apolipoprotein N-acyltransferase
MPDPIEGPIGLVWFSFALALFLWTAIDTQRVLRLLGFMYRRTLTVSATVILSIRILAIFGVCGLGATLIAHFVRLR